MQIVDNAHVVYIHSLSNFFASVKCCCTRETEDESWFVVQESALRGGSLHKRHKMNKPNNSHIAHVHTHHTDTSTQTSDT